MKNKPIEEEFGIGATDELSLRVSVAALVRVRLKDPENGEPLLALERKATLQKQSNGNTVEITVQPFGGALRILDTYLLEQAFGDFHFDSQRTRAERDFRIFIRPAAWESLQEFCLQQLAKPSSPVLETDPSRELTEEFASTMRKSLVPEQWTCEPVGTVIENAPAPTANAYSQGSLTARILRVFEAHLIDAALARYMVTVSHRYSNPDLEKLALEDVLRGGRGWANTVLTLPWNPLLSFYTTLSPETLNQPLAYQGHRLDETVAAVLEGVNVPKYRRL
jgi:hypothetical protein